MPKISQSTPGLPAPLAPETDTVPAAIAAYSDRARDFAAHARAEATRRAYASDFQIFADWCVARGASSLPAAPATVLAFLIDGADGVKVSTLQRRLVAIREAHRRVGLELDTSGAAFRDAWKGLRRTRGLPPAKKAALVTGELRAALASLPETLIGVRDRALLLIGFAGALRRSELAGLLAAPANGASHVEVISDGLLIHLARSKTDQLAEGQTIGVPYGSHPETCPVRAYKNWIAAAGIVEGPVFPAINRHGKAGSISMSDRAVALVVKRTIFAAALAAGATEEEAARRASRFAGHSLRSGLATSAAAHDAPGHAIQRQLRHRKFETTAGYIQAGKLFKQNAAGMAGL